MVPKVTAPAIRIEKAEKIVNTPSPEVVTLETVLNPIIKKKVSLRTNSSGKNFHLKVSHRNKLKQVDLYYLQSCILSVYVLDSYNGAVIWLACPFIVTYKFISTCRKTMKEKLWNGKGCNHIAALLYAIADIIEMKKDGAFASTSMMCKWNNPRKRKLTLKKTLRCRF
ncbi:hypothetical protein ACF0H5_022708 [Mactra antiquata]